MWGTFIFVRPYETFPRLFMLREHLHHVVAINQKVLYAVNRNEELTTFDTETFHRI